VPAGEPGVGALEHVLPADAVEHDEHHRALGAVRDRTLHHRRRRDGLAALDPHGDGLRRRRARDRASERHRQGGGRNE